MEGAINRTLRVLVAVCERGPASLTELSAETGLAPPTLLRTLRLMNDEGFAQQADDRRWQATMLVWRLGCAVSASTTRSASAHQVLSDLAKEIGETVVYAAYEKGYLTYVATAEPDKPFRTHVPLGGHHPALDTVTGHAVLAFLRQQDIDEVLATQTEHALSARGRQRLLRNLLEFAQHGWASGAGNRWPGVWGAAAPVFGQHRNPVGAIGMSIPQTDPPENADHIVRNIVSASHVLSQRFGNDGTPPRSPLLR